MDVRLNLALDRFRKTVHCQRRFPGPAPFRNRSLLLLLSLALFLAGNGLPASATNTPQTNNIPDHLLLIDRFGRPIRKGTNEVPSALQPPPAIGLGQQIPHAPKGTPAPEAVRERIIESKTGRVWFPSTPPVIAPYLADINEYGNTAIQPGPLLPIEPHSRLAQQAKYAASDVGNDYLAAGFVWSQPSAVLKPSAHANEYGFETTYVMQLTPLASIQPDFQVIWNPANNPNAGQNLIFQLQFNLVW